MTRILSVNPTLDGRNHQGMEMNDCEQPPTHPAVHRGVIACAGDYSPDVR